MIRISSPRKIPVSQRHKLLCCAVPLLWCAAMAAQTPKFVSFDVPGALSTSVNDINENRVVTGYYLDATTSHGYVRSGSGQFTKFDVPGSTFTSPAAR